MSLITVQNLKFSYPQQKHYCIDDVSFVIEKGSYTAIVGLNGSGKSTLAKLICGLEIQEQGTIQIKENNRIGIVFQSPKDQIVSSIVSRDTAFGPQNLGLNNGEVELRTIECLNVVDLLDRAHCSTSALSLGQTQKVALSGVLALYPEILILDEAVSFLDPLSKKEILEFVKYYHKCGNTIIQITHDSDVVNEADNVICMEKGKITFYGTKNAFFLDKEKSQIINGNPLPKNERNIAREIKKCTLKVDNITFNYKNSQKTGVQNISFNLFEGSLTALTGPSGSGKSTILELCAGLLQVQEGKILTTQKPVLCQQNASAALFENFAIDDVAFGPKNFGKKGDELKQIVKNAMNKAYIPFDDFMDRKTFALSGGEQRRLSIAGILAMDSEIILFDEPTAGLDCKARFEVMKMLRNLADEGKTVLFSTHHTDEANFADGEIRVENGLLKHGNKSIENALPLHNDLLNDKNENTNVVELLTRLRNISLSLSSEHKMSKNKTSLVERMHPSLRILLFLSLFVLSLSFSNVLLCLFMLGLSIVYAKMCGFGLKKFFNSCVKILPFLLIFTVFQLIFHSPLTNEIFFTSWKWFTITPSKLFFCLASILRTFAALSCICSFFVSTPEYDLIDGLQILLKPLRVIKIPVQYFILIVEIIFRFIPLLVDEASAIIKTQSIRGGFKKVKGKKAKIRAIIPLIVPLIVQTIKRASSLGVAITMRGFR